MVTIEILKISVTYNNSITVFHRLLHNTPYSKNFYHTISYLNYIGGQFMEKKMFQTGRGFAIIKAILLAIIIVFFSVLGMFMVKLNFTGEHVEDAHTFGDYVYLDAVYASDLFGTDHAGNRYMFVSIKDEEKDEMHDYMFGISEKDFVETGLDKLVEATYSKEPIEIQPIHLTAYIEKSDAELDKLASEAYIHYVGDETITDPMEYLGNFCLVYSNDSALQRMGFGDWIMYLFVEIIIIMSAFEMVKIIKKQMKKENKIALCKELYERDKEYAQGLSEVDMSDTVFYKQLKCYITPNYIVTFQDGLEVFRIEDIKELYGYDEVNHSVLLGILFGWFASRRSNHYLAAVTSDNELHLFAKTSMVGKLHNQVVSHLIQKNPEILLGRKGVAVSDLEQDLTNLKLSKISGFYGDSSVWKGRVKETFIS